MDLVKREALDLWRDIAKKSIKEQGPDLTTRQTAILLTIHLDDEKHTVRGLAKRLGLNKPAIVRALDALQALELVKRVRDENDKRNVFIFSTDKGAEKLSQIAGIIVSGLTNIKDTQLSFVKNSLQFPTPANSPDNNEMYRH